MRIHRQRLLRFYDTKDPAADAMGSHVAAITALLGEDLLLALLQSYWARQGYRSQVLSYRCKAPGRSGPRLDAWLLRERGKERIVFQTEVKNWAAYSTGEIETPLNHSAAGIRKQARDQWDYYFGGPKIPLERVAKVLTPGMVPPAEFSGLPYLPLVCFWFVISKNPPSCYSVQRRSGRLFKELHVFSGSLFVRGLKSRVIDLSVQGLPRLVERLRLLDELLPLRTR